MRDACNIDLIKHIVGCIQPLFGTSGSVGGVQPVCLQLAKERLKLPIFRIGIFDFLPCLTVDISGESTERYFRMSASM